MNFREGDIVSVEATLAYVHSDDKHFRLHVRNHHGPTYVPRESVKLVKPNIQIGDQVKLKDPHNHQPQGPATVLAISGEHLWVEWGEGLYATWWADLVERVTLAGQEPEVWEEGGTPEGGDA